MTDSLREQLLQAGFKEKNPKKKSDGKDSGAKKRSGKAAAGKNGPGRQGSQKNRGAGKPSNTRAPVKRSKAAEEAAEVAAHEAKKQAEKKAIKEKIRVLIEENQIKEHAGDVAYSYQVGTRVRQMFVKQEYQTKLSAGELVITRLNGNTLLIPPDVAEQVLALNSDWAIIRIEDQTSDAEADPDYADYKIPDDLTW
ncbi:MAG: DUF2058 domain-containing protein [Granulosicoccus sp.]|nr:DUF2058 domain-containing protein [Granulosicoccus sp.]